ncbi:MAG: inositol monophosphatase family protein [Thermoleophilaceae bacterium]
MSGAEPVPELVRELALALRERVVPLLGSHAARAHEEELAAGGDVTFAIDAAAEELLASFLAERAPELAFYSEDRGLVTPGGNADTVLIVDPIDGTRPALAGFQSCCVSVAAAPLREDVTMGEVSVGCVVEIPSGRVFLAERGRGLLEGGPVRLSANTSPERMFWAYGFRGRPMRVYAELLGDLVDASSVGGGTFELGSACFDMTRVLTGQLDAYIEPGPRLIEDVPATRAEFERVGGGAVLNNSPYDLAAATLCLIEGGAVVTDASGRTLTDHRLLGSSAEYQMSVVASANRRLHETILEQLDAGMDRVAFRFHQAEETEAR